MRQLTGGLILMAVVSFFTFTEPGQELLIKGIDVVSNEASNWLIDRFNETEERAESRGPRSQRKCGDEYPPVGADISEEQAIEAAARMWELKKKVPCEDIQTELLADETPPRWHVTFYKKHGCQVDAFVDAITGEGLDVGGGCP